MRGIFLGVFLTIAILLLRGYWFGSSGRLSMATNAPPLPMEETVAKLAIRGSMGNAKDLGDPLSINDSNMQAGAKLYKDNCAGCHGAPQQPHPAISKSMFPPPPQLFEKDSMV